MVTLLLYPAVIMLLATLLRKDKFAASGLTAVIIGAGYFVWGIAATFQTPDEHVNPSDPPRMVIGFALFIVGIFFVWWEPRYDNDRW